MPHAELAGVGKRWLEVVERAMGIEKYRWRAVAVWNHEVANQLESAHRQLPARPEIRSIEMASPKQPFNSGVLTPSRLHQVLMLITSGDGGKLTRKQPRKPIGDCPFCSYSGRFIFCRKAAKRGSCAKFFKRGST
jgi:hypothetical protein